MHLSISLITLEYSACHDMYYRHNRALRPWPESIDVNQELLVEQLVVKAYQQMATDNRDAISYDDIGALFSKATGGNRRKCCNVNNITVDSQACSCSF